VLQLNLGALKEQTMIASRTMQTGQKSIAPENRLPQLGQVRRGFVFMDLSVLRIANIEHPVMIVNGTKSEGRRQESEDRTLNRERQTANAEKAEGRSQNSEYRIQEVGSYGS